MYSNFVRQLCICNGQEVMLILSCDSIMCGLNNVPSVCSDDILPQACPTPVVQRGTQHVLLG